MKGSPDSVLLLAFGGPTRPEEVRPFLDNVLRGRPVPKERYEEVVAHYDLFGGISPLTRLTMQQAEGLRLALARDDGPSLPVYVGMRHWNPSITKALSVMAGSGVEWCVGLILGAHPSHSSREAYYDAVIAAQKEIGPAAPRIEYAGEWFDHPLFIEAIAARLCSTIAAIPEERRDAAALVFTGHSIPVEMSDTSGYDDSLRRTAGLVARALKRESWSLAYQSRSGAPQERWLEPDIGDELIKLHHKGVRDVIVAPIGFVSDHVEVLYDLDIKARSVADELGIGIHRAGTVGDHPAFLRMLAAIVEKTIAGVGA